MAGANSLAQALKVNSTLYDQIDCISFFQNSCDSRRSHLDFNSIILHLFGNAIGDAGASAIADALRDNTSLERIYLGANQIGDQGAKALADTLRENTLTLEQVQELTDDDETPPYLTALNLDDNVIGDIGVSALANALRDNTTLRILDLSTNRIGDGGACT